MTETLSQKLIVGEEEAVEKLFSALGTPLYVN
jgi:hypothetical protein